MRKKRKKIYDFIGSLIGASLIAAFFVSFLVFINMPQYMVFPLWLIFTVLLTFPIYSRIKK